mgnify:CR=1 FL=1
MNGWQPSAGPEVARTRASMLERIRRYFVACDVLEVDTPALSASAVSDTQIESLEIADSLVCPRPLYLATSPEFCMKRLLADGYPDIYSICRVFRDGESGRQHQPEFTMVEWYRLGFGLEQIVSDTLQLIAAALDEPSLSRNAVQHDYRSLFRESVGLDPLTASIDELARACDADDDLRRAIGDERDDWLDLLLSTRIVPGFADDRLTVLRHYPASQAALARLCPDDADVADRFEVFAGSVELANGYVELTDAREQAERIRHDIESRQRRKRPAYPVDGKLLAALEAGLPPCAGVAVGFERLHMLHDKTDDIRDVLTFAFEARV